jgi:coatomer subunit beta'
MTIKAWDWDKNWKCVQVCTLSSFYHAVRPFPHTPSPSPTQVFEGHTHYIMNIAVNPKDTNTFASSCLDRTVKMWSLGSPNANFTMDAHEKGVNCVDFYPGPDRPYLVTASDDKTIRIWDYLSKSCVQTLQSHTNNVLFVAFHPRLPVIVSGGEDGTVKLWNAGTYRLENTLGYALERAWCMAFRPEGNDVAFGYDEGLVTIALGRDEPSFSMDPSGKLVYTRNLDVLSANLSTLADEDGGAAVADGARIPLSTKELGSTEVFATALLHSPNGRFVTVVGDGEYIVYTALAWRNKAFGQASAFAWAADSNTYAVAEGRTRVRVWRAFKERTTPAMKGAGGFNVEGLYGGPLLAARSAGFVLFWDWETGEIVRRIDVESKNVWESSSFFFLNGVAN